MDAAFSAGAGGADAPAPKLKDGLGASSFVSVAGTDGWASAGALADVERAGAAPKLKSGFEGALSAVFSSFFASGAFDPNENGLADAGRASLEGAGSDAAAGFGAALPRPPKKLGTAALAGSAG